MNDQDKPIPTPYMGTSEKQLETETKVHHISLLNALESFLKICSLDFKITCQTHPDGEHIRNIVITIK